MVTMTIDGKTVQAEEGTYLLQAAKKLGVEIPAVCAHDGVEPFAACRLCTVEIRKPGWTDDWTKMVSSCVYPVEEGLSVMTASERVLRTRKTLFELLLARCPESQVVRDWAREYGVESTDLVHRDEPDDCILCGLCVRVCGKVGTYAISTSQRGAERVVGPPYGEADACIGCLSCGHNCPTGHIEFSSGGNSRQIWGRTFELEPCPGCGEGHVTKEQVAYYSERHDLPAEHYALCDACKQARTAEVFAGLAPREGAQA